MFVWLTVKSCYVAIQTSVSVVTFKSFEAGFYLLSFKLRVLAKFYKLYLVMMSVSLSVEF